MRELWPYHSSRFCNLAKSLPQVSVLLAFKAIAPAVKLIPTISVIFVYLVMEEILHQVA